MDYRERLYQKFLFPKREFGYTIFVESGIRVLRVTKTKFSFRILSILLLFTNWIYNNTYAIVVVAL